jgi:hypothetical protein
MSATFDRAAILKAAHFMARYRVATVGGAYREWFAKSLAYEWKKAKAARLREESNIGLPIRSCLADAPAARLPPWWEQAKRNAQFRQLYTRESGRRAGSFAA